MKFIFDLMDEVDLLFSKNITRLEPLATPKIPDLHHSNNTHA
jgi:hypothetical protein